MERCNIARRVVAVLDQPPDGREPSERVPAANDGDVEGFAVPENHVGEELLVADKRDASALPRTAEMATRAHREMCQARGGRSTYRMGARSAGRGGLYGLSLGPCATTSGKGPFHVCGNPM